jgi:iron(III) transport system substrate-binding protein
MTCLRCTQTYPSGSGPGAGSGWARSRWIALLLCGLAAAGCRKETSQRLVVYCSVDETFGRQVLDAFRAEHDIEVDVIFDTEAGKTTGLVKRIELERDHPRADVFWSSELFNTILLARAGLLEPYDSPAAADIPARYRDPQRRWTAIGLRARVLAFDPSRTPADQVPAKWHDLADPAVAPKLAFANPLFGTTRGQVAAQFALWGPQKATAFLEALRTHGAKMVDGNSAAVREVMQGRAELAMTDTDDVVVANRSGASLKMRYPDLGDGGTLLIPNSIAILRGARHPELARELVDYLVSARVEEMLARSDSKNVPVRAALRKKLGMELPPESNLSYDAIADAMDEAVAAVREHLIR